MIAALARLAGEDAAAGKPPASPARSATVRYAEFRRFCILLPREKLWQEQDVRLAWFEAATYMPIRGARLPCLCGTRRHTGCTLQAVQGLLTGAPSCMEHCCSAARRTALVVPRASTPRLRHVPARSRERSLRRATRPA